MKKTINFKDKILKTACAFANNLMNNEINLLFIGIEEVDDENTGEKAIPKRPITGIDESQIESTENELKKILSNIRPTINYEIISDKIDDKPYLIVAIEGNSSGSYRTTDVAEKKKGIKLKAGKYVRKERDTKLATPLEENELNRKFSNYHFSSSLNSTATINDLNYEYMKEYLVQTRAKEDVINLSKLEMANCLGLVSNSDYGGYRAKNFAVLMFANKPKEFIDGASVNIIREVEGTDKMTSKEFDGPIWIQVQQAIEYFKSNILESYTIRKDNKIEHEIIYNFPLPAFEEIITNAVLHKDYDKREYVGVYVRKDEISFVNHNRPLPPVTIDDLKTKKSFDTRKYLNTEIKDMFFALKLIESYGSGIKRAKESLEKNGSPELEFYPQNENDDYTQVIIKIHPEFLKDSKEKEFERLFSDNNGLFKSLTDNEKDIIKIIIDNSYVTAKEISEKLSITTDSVYFNFKKLKNKNILTYEGPKKLRKWIIRFDFKKQ
ncbi:RNA-binding domain-containing protein [Mycoplasmopsis gallinacea]|uniref:RNA-binding domain-containing protein n=1 Tax=Mycoplasmopsis gallinacea TaxID=29556 RepID=UPI0029622ED1|nr:RNA-binding domain-containing protein [Mycoplasmopsis gallinacea]